MRGLRPVVVLVGAKSNRYEASVSGNTIVLTRRGSAPTPNPTPNPTPSPTPNPNPSPDSGKDSSGGGCDTGLLGTVGLTLLLAASLLLRRR